VAGETAGDPIELTLAPGCDGANDLGYGRPAEGAMISMYGDDIPMGSYIGDDRRIMQPDGSPDARSRKVDEKGYILLEDGGYDEYGFVDATGVVHDGRGMATAAQLGVPGDWSVLPQPHEGTPDVPWEEPYQTDDPGDGIHQRSAWDRDQELSDTEGTSPDPAKLTQFVDGIVKTKALDGEGGDLGWAAENDPAARGLHGRQIGHEFQGEDTESTAFRAGTVRAGVGAGDQWTTEYGTSGPDTHHQSVKSTSVDAGKLVGPDGAPLTGEFGYVVDAQDGALYTFTEGEMWAQTPTGWVNIGGTSKDVLLKALADGRQIRAVHHSSAISGAPAGGAGTLTVDNGTITKISNESGHYSPEAEYIWQTIEWLALQGMATDDIRVSIIQKERNAPMILEAWKLSQGHGNAAQVAAKDEAMFELRRNAEAKAFAALPTDSLLRKHYEATRCTTLDVRRWSASMGGYLYCAHDEETDLGAAYATLQDKGPQSVG
jgi:hypothetical protein